MKEYFIRHRRVGDVEKVGALETSDLREAIEEAVRDYEMYEDFLHMQQEMFVLIEAESSGTGGYVPGTESTVIDIRAEALHLGRPTRPSEEVDLSEYLIEEHCGIIINQRRLMTIVAGLREEVGFVRGRTYQIRKRNPALITADIEAALGRLRGAYMELIMCPECTEIHDSVRKAIAAADQLLDGDN